MSVQTANNDIMNRLGEAGRAFGGRFGKSGVRVPSIAPRLLELVIVLVIAWLAMRLVYSFAPAGAPVAGSPANVAATGAASAADMSVFSRFDPFAASPVGAEPVNEVSEARETSLDIALNGIWAEPDGTGIAIIQAGSREQRMHRVGDEIMNGVILDRLYPDRAIILRGGVRESVFLENRLSGGAGMSRPAASPQRSAGPSPATVGAQGVSAESLSQIISVRPVRESGVTIGYEIYPRGDGTTFSRLGFVEGDRILSINGNAAPNDSERLIELMQELESASTVMIEIDRGGAPVSLSFDMSDLQ